MALFVIIVGAAALKVIDFTTTSERFRALLGRYDLPIVDFHWVTGAVVASELVAAGMLTGRRFRIVGHGLLAMGFSSYLAYLVILCSSGAVPTPCPCFGPILLFAPSCGAEIGRTALLLALTVGGPVLERLVGPRIAG